MMEFKEMKECFDKEEASYKDNEAFIERLLHDGNDARELN